MTCMHTHVYIITIHIKVCICQNKIRAMRISIVHDLPMHWVEYPTILVLKLLSSCIINSIYDHIPLKCFYIY